MYSFYNKRASVGYHYVKTFRGCARNRNYYECGQRLSTTMIESEEELSKSEEEVLETESNGDTMSTSTRIRRSALVR